MKLNIVTGFLGSGKTTAIRNAVGLLTRENIPVGVITNDQGSRLVDGDFFAALGIPGRQVARGCFCCNYNALDENIRSLAATNGSSVIFGEAVGSCTDIIATVLNPLQHFYPEMGLTVSTFTDIRLLKMVLNGNHSFDESVAYIYLKQLEEAEIIIVNKIDLVSNEFISDIKKQLNDRYPGKLLLFQDSNDEQHIMKWIETMRSYKLSGTSSVLDIDYDVYAAGEAKMAWYDRQLEIYTGKNDAGLIAEQLINTIYNELIKLNSPIGHIKFLVDGVMKFGFTSLHEEPVKLKLQPAPTATLLINIRVQESPEIIRNLLDHVLSEFSFEGKIISGEADVFSPGYPTPVHRF